MKCARCKQDKPDADFEATIKGGATRVELFALQQEIVAELKFIKLAKSEVFEVGPSVHGARQHSRLDLLGVWEMKACAMFDNVADLIRITKK